MLLIYLSMLETAEEKDFFEKIYLEHRDLMFNVANRILNNEHLAEVATHDAFLKIVKHVGRDILKEHSWANISFAQLPCY